MLYIRAGCQFTGYYSPELKSSGIIRWGNMNYERLDCFRTTKCSYLFSCLILDFCPEMIRKQYRTVDEPIRFSAGHTSVVPGQWSVSTKKSTVKSRRPWLNLHQILSCGCNKTSQNMLPLALGGLMWMCLQKEGTFPAADIQNVIRQKSEQRLDRGRGFMSCNCLDHSVLHASWYCSLHSDVHQAQCGQFF